MFSKQIQMQIQVETNAAGEFFSYCHEQVKYTSDMKYCGTKKCLV